MTLGWALYASALGAAFALAAIAAERAMVAQRRSTRWIWCASIAASLGVPLAAYLVPAAVPAATAELLPTEPVTWIDLGAGGLASETPLLTRLDSAFPYIWAALSVTMLAWLAWSAWRLHRARGTWTERQVGGVGVLESPGVGPAVVGFFGGRITVPGWLRELDDELQRLVILHEREHQRGRDPLLLWMGWLAVVLAPWNPALWWQLRRLRLAIEVDCDRRVLAHGVSLDRYGTLLLEVGRRVSTRPLLAVALFETRSFLERRVRAMTASASRRAPRAIAALGAVTLVIGFAIAAPVPVKPLRTVTPEPASAEPPAVVTPAVQDTPPRFAFTPYTVKPTCLVACNPDDLIGHFRDSNAPATCDVTIGIRIDTEGTVTATEILKSSEPACEEGARSWAMTTRWSPGELEGRPVIVWIAQPITVNGDDDFAAAAPKDITMSALRLFMVVQEQHRRDHGNYASTLGDLRIAPPPNVTIEITRGGDSYAMIARHAQSEAVYCANSAEGRVTEGSAC